MNYAYCGNACSRGWMLMHDYHSGSLGLLWRLCNHILVQAWIQSMTCHVLVLFSFTQGVALAIMPLTTCPDMLFYMNVHVKSAKPTLVWRIIFTNSNQRLVLEGFSNNQSNVKCNSIYNPESFVHVDGTLRESLCYVPHTYIVITKPPQETGSSPARRSL